MTVTLALVALLIVLRVGLYYYGKSIERRNLETEKKENEEKQAPT